MTIYKKTVLIVVCVLAGATSVLCALYLFLPFFYMANSEHIVIGMLDNEYIDAKYSGWQCTALPEVGEIYLPPDWRIEGENLDVLIYDNNRLLAIGSETGLPDSVLIESNIEEVFISTSPILQDWNDVGISAYKLVRSDNTKDYIYTLEFPSYYLLFNIEDNEEDFLKILEAIAFSYEPASEHW